MSQFPNVIYLIVTQWPHYGLRNLGCQWFRKRFVVFRAPSCLPKPCWWIIYKAKQYIWLDLTLEVIYTLEVYIYMYIYICVCVQNLNLVITVPADALAPNGARPSAGTVLTEKLAMFSLKFHWLSMILCTGDIIQNDHRNPANSLATWGVKITLWMISYTVLDWMHEKMIVLPSS